MTRIITLMGLLFMCGVNAQTFSWAKQLGGIDADELIASDVDADGNIYLVSRLFVTADYDPGEGVEEISGNSCVFTKLNSDGELIFTKQFFADLFDVEVDHDGAIYLSGRAAEGTDIAPGDDVYEIGSSLAAAFIIKLDEDAGFLWAREYNYRVSYAVVSSDSGGNVYFVGSFWESVDFDPGTGETILTADAGALAGTDNAFVSKLSSGGIFQWAKAITGFYNVYVEGFAVDDDGNCYLTGGYQPGSVTLGDQLTVSSYYENSMFLAKMDAAGSFEWVQNLSEATPTTNIVIDSNNDLYFCSYFDGFYDADPGAGEVFFNSWEGSWDIILHKFSDSGNYIWANHIGYVHELYTAIALDSFDNVYTAGIFGFPLDFDAGEGTFNMTPQVYDEATFISKHNSDGILLYAQQFEAKYDYRPQLGIDADNNVYLANHFVETVELDPHYINEYELTSFGSRDIYIAKIGNDAAAGLEDYAVASAMLFPNPTVGQVSISLPQSAEDASITVADLNGRELLQRSFAGGGTISLDIPGAAGVYMATVASGSEKKHFKIIKQ